MGTRVRPRLRQEPYVRPEDFEYLEDTGDASSCCNTCCYARGAWWYGCWSGFMIFVFLVSAVALALGIVAVVQQQDLTSQKVYTVSDNIASNPLSHVFSGPAVQTMVLPNDLRDFVGKVYNLDCDSAFAHRIEIAPGSLVTTFDGANTIATCGGTIGAGLTIKVNSPSTMRIIGSNDIVLSN